jgi:hypothetical protein
VVKMREYGGAAGEKNEKTYTQDAARGRWGSIFLNVGSSVVIPACS